MKIILHDLNCDPVKTQTFGINDDLSGLDSCDRMAVETAFEMGDVITIGKVIAEPVRD